MVDKKSNKNPWKTAFIIAVIIPIALALLFGIILFSINFFKGVFSADEFNTWKQYENILTNDQERISYLHEEGECSILETEEEINTCLNFLIPALDTYHTHLLEAKEFLLINGEVFSNKVSLQESLDNQIYEVIASKNMLNDTLS